MSKITASSPRRTVVVSKSVDYGMVMRRRHTLLPDLPKIQPKKYSLCQLPFRHKEAQNQPTHSDSESNNQDNSSGAEEEFRLKRIEEDFMDLEYTLEALTELTGDLVEKPEADDLIDQVFTVALSTSACTEHLRLMAEALHKKWISEPGFAPIAAKISYRLRDIMTESDIPFWTILYGLVWTDFKDRLSIRKISHTIFAHSAHYAFEFFRLFYDGASNSVFYVLVDCLYVYATELIDDVCIDDEILMFHTLFVKMGKQLEKLNKPKLEAVLVCVRKRLIEFTTSAACRCALMEILELHERNWDPDSIPYKVRKLYRSYDPVKEQKRRRRYEGRLGGKSALFSSEPGANLVMPPTESDAFGKSSNSHSSTTDGDQESGSGSGSEVDCNDGDVCDMQN